MCKEKVQKRVEIHVANDVNCSCFYLCAYHIHTFNYKIQEHCSCESVRAQTKKRNKAMYDAGTYCKEELQIVISLQDSPL